MNRQDVKFTKVGTSARETSSPAGSYLVAREGDGWRAEGPGLWERFATRAAALDAVRDAVVADSSLRTHRLDRENDRCVCGGMWVWWEAANERPGVYGCEEQGHEAAYQFNRGRDQYDRLVDEEAL